MVMQFIDKFRVVRRIVSGGLSEVFEVHDDRADRRVALKRERADLPPARHVRCRALFEADVLAQLDHPGVVPVHEAGVLPDGRAYFTMHLVEGEDLRASIRRAHACDDPPGWAEAVRYLVARLAEACDTLAHAHARGVVHRDLTPKNIMLGPHGETLIIDWGLAKLIGAHEGEGEGTTIRSAHDLDSTQIGSVLGTPRYMSPEQAGAELDRQGPATDVYGMGAVLYHALTGTAPFEGDDMHDIHGRVYRGDFPTPSSVCPLVDRRIEQICLKAMARKPRNRHGSARELREDLRTWLDDLTSAR
jgi:serine/threonine protein kinase